MNPKKFTATTSWAKSVSELPDKTRLEIYDSLFSYVDTGKIPKISAEAKAAFSFIKTDIDLETEKALETCEKRKKSILKRWNREANPD